MINPVSPFPGVTIESVPESSKQDVALAVAKARKAQTAWANTEVSNRVKILDRFHKLLIENQDELLTTIQAETGKSRFHAADEILGLAMITAHYAKIGKRALAPKRRAGALPIFTKTYVLSQPKGVIGIISPWNYPLVLSICDALPAILAGNTVVVRPDSQTPWSAIRGLNLLRQAGLPEDVITIVTGDGNTTGTALIDEVDYVCFTGSTKTGKIVAAQAGARLIGASLELGGKNPMIVCADANLDTFLEVAIRGCFTSAGQLCVSIERMYIHDSIYEKFLAAFVARVKELMLGAQLGWGYDVGSLATDALANRVTEAISTAVAQGAKVETGGKLRTDIGPNVYEPTVLTGVTKGMKISTEEVFGPCVYVQPFSSTEEAIALANDSIYGLSASVITSNARNGRQIAEQLRSGSVNINEGFAAAYGSVAAPMGGMGQSGLGRRHGIEGLLRFTQPQTIARQRWISIGPKFGFDEEQWTKLLGKSLLILKRLRIR
ncbi:MAG: aldehyde dehydrogenase family protein [Actinobacteria bacterium]|jgi:succinate-semialdehyde dehydrogenase/glutarate-semialdehyde dehydrogenase|nr:aldehyde dehydrogenase family protein [Actinomycetota bacterium]